MGTVKFWQEMQKATEILGADKMMIGKNSTGEAQYTDFELANQFLSVQGIEMKPVPAGALPAGPADQVRTMEILDAGTWTYGGNSFVNPSGSIMKLWWDGTTWSLGSSVALPVTPASDNIVKDGTEPTSTGASYLIKERTDYGFTTSPKFVMLKDTGYDGTIAYETGTILGWGENLGKLQNFSALYLPKFKYSQAAYPITRIRLLLIKYLPILAVMYRDFPSCR